MVDATNLPSLTVGGAVYHGWKSMTVTRSIETVAGGFSLSLTERWDNAATRWPIDPGDAAELRLGGDTVIAGYVDAVERSIAPRQHQVSIEGRDRTGDLVDNAALHEPDEFTGLTLQQLAEIIARPFGIRVAAAVDIGAPISSFKIEPGETAYAAIERACRLRAILPMSDGQGGLLLTRAGLAATAGALVEGENVATARLAYGWKERHSRIIVKGQTPELGRTEAALPGLSPAAMGEAVDHSITRYRPRLVLAEMPADGPSAAERAAWEVGVRAGRSVQVVVTVPGWRQPATASVPGGALWPLNALCPVRLPSLDIDQTLLITGLRFSIDAGSRTEITLTRPDAFRLLPELGKGKKSQGLPPGTEVIKTLEQLQP